MKSLTKTHDWTQFTERTYVNCSLDELFEYWITSNGIMSFFMKEAAYIDSQGRKRDPHEYARAGDIYKWQFHTGKQSDGTLLEVVKNKLMKFTFGEQDSETGEDTIVTIKFHNDENSVWFDLIQSNMRDTLFYKIVYNISCNMGWLFHVNNLKSIIATGYDLRYLTGDRMHVDAPSSRPVDEFQWDRIILDEYVIAPTELIFTNWSTSNGLQKWMLVDSQFSYMDTNGEIKIRGDDELIQNGDNYSWKWQSGIEMQGRVVNIKVNKSISFTFGQDQLLTVEFETEEDKCNIYLVQSNIPDTEIGNYDWNRACYLGWTFYLLNLRSIFENNFDLRK